MELRPRLARSAARLLINPRGYSVGAHRLAFWAVARATRMPAGARVRRADAGGVAAHWVDGFAGRPRRWIFYLHGGGYSAGSLGTHLPLCAGLCQEAGAAGLLPDYRRAPRHPYPAALDDALAAWRWLLASGVDPRVTAVCGDSAGGGLALSLMARLRDAGAPLPRAAYLLSPWVDLTDHRRLDNTAVMDAMLAEVGALYAGEHDPRDPLISPVYGDLAGLPPVLVQAGDREPLAQDARRLVERLRASGVAVTFEPYPSLLHGLPFISRLSARARALTRSTGRFLRAQLRRDPGRIRADREDPVRAPSTGPARGAPGGAGGAADPCYRVP